MEQSIEEVSYQTCQLWSRFLGELYKYDLIKRSFLFQQLGRFVTLPPRNHILVLNLACTVLESCETYLTFKKIVANNQKFLFLAQFKRYIHACPYVPMLEEFKIVDVLDEL